jgi:hypothetical protein
MSGTSQVAGCDRFPGARSGSCAPNEVGDAVAECVGGVVVGQIAHTRSDLQDSHGVVAGRGECDESSQDHRRVGVGLPDPVGRRAGSTEKGHTGLASYYTQRGETPRVWVGTEMAGIEGLDAGDMVTAGQMRSLFGAGMHPLARQRMNPSRSKSCNIHILHTRSISGG